MLDAVQPLVGHCACFDFQESSDRIPKLDLPAIKPFFTSMLALHSRRVQDGDEGLTFKTPDDWPMTPAMQTNYRDMIFCRDVAESVNLDSGWSLR